MTLNLYFGLFLKFYVLSVKYQNNGVITTWIISRVVFFPQSMAHKWNKTQTRVLGNRFFFEHTALCKFEKRLSQTFAFYLCEPRLPRIFFHIIIVETTHFCTLLVLVLYGHTKMRFKAVKLHNFHRFHRDLKRPSFNGQ